MSAFSDDVDSIKAGVQNHTIWKAFLKVTAAHPNSCHLKMQQHEAFDITAQKDPGKG